jgi:SAM-dependent methyltransferase
VDWTPQSYGDDWADVYDERFANVDDLDLVIGVLIELAAGRPLLELGSGTGRICNILALRGHDVTGLEASEKMIKRMRGKPGGDLVDVVLGDFAKFKLDRRYGLIYLSCNTFFGLPTQQLQVACVKRAAEHLTEDGLLLLECSLPEALIGKTTVRTIRLEGQQALIEAVQHDAGAQQLLRQRMRIDSHGVVFGPVRVRYVWPSELDLMAQLAGLSLAERWGGWERQRVSAASRGHISIYSRPAGED